MKLVFIYGPPASGKLTIAENLSTLTGIPVFHNHLSRDLVKDIYGDELLSHYTLVDTIRIDVLGYCAKNNTDLIFTYVYGGSYDDDNVRALIDCVERNGGTVELIELTADRDDLIDRIDNDSRKKFKKLTDRTIMKKITNDLSDYSIPFVEAIKINTSKTSAHEAAKLIAAKLQLFES